MSDVSSASSVEEDYVIRQIKEWDDERGVKTDIKIAAQCLLGVFNDIEKQFAEWPLQVVPFARSWLELVRRLFDYHCMVEPSIHPYDHDSNRIGESFQFSEERMTITEWIDDISEQYDKDPILPKHRPLIKSHIAESLRELAVHFFRWRKFNSEVKDDSDWNFMSSIIDEKAIPMIRSVLKFDEIAEFTWDKEGLASCASTRILSEMEDSTMRYRFVSPDVLNRGRDLDSAHLSFQSLSVLCRPYIPERRKSFDFDQKPASGRSVGSTGQTAIPAGASSSTNTGSSSTTSGYQIQDLIKHWSGRKRVNEIPEIGLDIQLAAQALRDIILYSKAVCEGNAKARAVFSESAANVHRSWCAVALKVLELYHMGTIPDETELPRKLIKDRITQMHQGMENEEIEEMKLQIALALTTVAKRFVAVLTTSLPPEKEKKTKSGSVGWIASSMTAKSKRNLEELDALAKAAVKAWTGCGLKFPTVQELITSMEGAGENYEFIANNFHGTDYEFMGFDYWLRFVYPKKTSMYRR